MKNKMYRRKVDTRDELLTDIMDAINCMDESQNEFRRAARHALTQVAKYNSLLGIDSGTTQKMSTFAFFAQVHFISAVFLSCKTSHF